MKEFTVEPPKAALANVESGEVMRFQFNPPELVEDLSVNWARLSPVGLSHQVLHYINTNNHRFPIEIYLSDVVRKIQESAAAPLVAFAAVSAGFGGPAAAGALPGTISNLKLPSRDQLDADNAKRFLQSLLYPYRTESGTFDPPPRVVFVWPSVVRMRCIVTGIRFRHRRFSIKTAATTVLTAEVTLEESRFMPLWSQFVRQFGSRRTP